MKTINQYIAEYKSLAEEFPDIKLTDILETLLKKINFLEEVYKDGSKYRFSEEFKDAAVYERRRLSQETGAIYEILKNK